MIDEIDSMLSRYLKNWAARHHPPADGREQLLEEAASLHASARRNSYGDIDYDFRGAEYLYRNSGNWLVGPISQSRLYSFHIATVIRMAT
jgi:hypothetical protein